MFEAYPMTHYDFSQLGRGLSEGDFATAELTTREQQALIHAEYQLRGSVDYLAFFPQPDDGWKEHMHLQTFSRMHATEGYFTERSHASSYLLLYTEEGRGSLCYEGSTVTLEAGDLFWIDCRNKHRYQTEGPFWTHVDVHVDGVGIALPYEEFHKDGRSVVRGSAAEGFLKDLTPVLDAYVQPSEKRGVRIAHAIESMLVNIVLREDGAAEDVYGGALAEELRMVVRYLHECYREPLSMDRLSDISGISKYHLSREFKKLTGFPPNEYLIRLRLEQAKRYLVNTDLQVSTIAELCGVPNEAYFSRLFRQRMHLPPGAYRKAHRQVPQRRPGWQNGYR